MKAVVTDPAEFLSLDLYTAKTSDLSFSAPFSMRVCRNDFVHALIAWFDIEFTACHRPIRFSTGPHAKYTHWKQTVFYIQDALIVEQGEVISGTLRSKPNAENKRNLDIEIEYLLNTADSARAAYAICEYKMWVLQIF
jgi:protein arginine N-methyltransferase 1